LQTITEVLQSIKASDMTPLLNRIYSSEGGSECLDVLMKYLSVYPLETLILLAGDGIADYRFCRYKGMASGPAGGTPRTPTRPSPSASGFSQMGGRPAGANETTTAAMSVLLSWHEKVVEVAGLGCIGRCMTDFRRV